MNAYERIAIGFLLTGLAPASSPARAEPAFWTTDGAVGESRFELTVEIECVGNPLCPFLDGISTSGATDLTGRGTAWVESGGTFELRTDQVLDVPPPSSVWRVEGEDFSMTPILIGTPRVENGVVFGVTGGPWEVPGLAFGPFGPVTVTTDLDLGLRFDLLGLGEDMPGQVAGPGLASATIDFEMTDAETFEVRNLFFDLTESSTTSLDPGTLTITQIGGVELNLSGRILLELRADAADLLWTPLATAQDYDVATGSLDGLLASGGDFITATDACAAEDHAGTTLSHASLLPAPGSARWFLVRASTGGGPGTYDIPFPGQTAPRPPDAPDGCGT